MGMGPVTHRGRDGGGHGGGGGSQVVRSRSWGLPLGDALWHNKERKVLSDLCWCCAKGQAGVGTDRGRSRVKISGTDVDHGLDGKVEMKRMSCCPQESRTQSVRMLP